MTTVLKIICLIALATVGCGTFKYGKAIQEETRIRLQKEKDYYLGLEFEGVVVEKNIMFLSKKT